MLSVKEQRKIYYEKNKERICAYYRKRYIEKKNEVNKDIKKEKNQDVFNIKHGLFIISFK